MSLFETNIILITRTIFFVILQARKTFNIDFADLHSSFRNSHYDWLPGQQQIPKELGEQLEQEFLDKLEVCIHSSFFFFPPCLLLFSPLTECE